MRRGRLLTTCAATVLLAACSGGPEPADNSDAPPPRGEETTEPGQASADACTEAFAVAEAGDGQLDTTLTACPDIATFTAAAADHTDVFDGVEPQVWLAEACTQASDPSVSESALCTEVAGEQD